VSMCVFSWCPPPPPFSKYLRLTTAVYGITYMCVICSTIHNPLRLVFVVVVLVLVVVATHEEGWFVSVMALPPGTRGQSVCAKPPFQWSKRSRMCCAGDNMCHRARAPPKASTRLIWHTGQTSLLSRNHGRTQSSWKT